MVEKDVFDRRAIAIVKFDPLVVPMEDLGSFLIDGLTSAKDGDLEVIVFDEIAVWWAANAIGK